MIEAKLAEGVVITASEDWRIRPTISARRSLGASFSASDPTAVLDRALREADYEIVADTMLEPQIAGPGRRSIGRRAEPDEPATIEIEVAAGEGAVLLLENGDGVFGWQLPDEFEKSKARRRGAAPAETLTFTIAPPAAKSPASKSGRRGLGGAIGWVADKLIEPIRVRVMRYAAAATIDAAVRRIEGDMPTGLVFMDNDSSWLPGGSLQGIQAREPGRAVRVLLFVHGTFSTTMGSFRALRESEEGDSFLKKARRHYDAIVGYDHRTLAETPLENGEQIAQALKFLPEGTIVDAIAYSRGGLVYRSLMETVGEEDRPAVTFGKAIFVGCTNSGTHLAEPDNWRALVDLYTNIAMAGSRALSIMGSPVAGTIAGIAIKFLARFVQALPEIGIEENRVPGLASMEPDGKFVKDINAQTRPLDAFFAVASDFEPRIDPESGITGALVQALGDSVVDRLMGRENDLVVDTPSMTGFGGGQMLPEVRVKRFGPAQGVYHTIYFFSDGVPSQFVDWLFGGEAGSAVEEESPPAPANDDQEKSARRRAVIGKRGPARKRAAARRSLKEKSDPEPPAGPVLDRSSFGVDRASLDGPEDEMAEAGAGFEEGAAVDEPSSELYDSTRQPPPSPASPLDGAEDAKTATLYFAADMNPTPLAGGVAPLYVTISREEIKVASHAAARVSEEAHEAKDDVPLQVEALAMENCWVLPSGRSPPEGSNGASVTEQVAVPDHTTTLRFLVQGSEPGKARIQIEISQESQALTSFAVEPTFMDPDSDGLHVGQSANTISPGEDYPSVLRIYEQRIPDLGLVLKFDLYGTLPPFAEKHEVTLPASFSVELFVSEFLKELDDAWNLTEQQYEQRLRQFRDFSINRTNELIPREIRQALWKSRNDIKAIQVLAENPHIPWELLYLDDPEGANPQEAGFLCEWGLVRWMYNARIPGVELPVRRGGFRYVVPDYLDPSHTLPSADREREILEDLFPGSQAIEPTVSAVEDFLFKDAQQCDILHFTCHGEIEQRAVLSADLLLRGIKLSDGSIEQERITCDTVKRFARFGEEAPSTLVFVNACQTGQAGSSIVGVSGFADSFLRPNTRRGAAAFIGAMWSIDDELAMNFSKSFYGAMCQPGVNLVEAGKRARLAAKDGNKTKGAWDFTWLAYTIYGNPRAQFSRLDQP